jgi:hypothetical protein
LLHETVTLLVLFGKVPVAVFEPDTDVTAFGYPSQMLVVTLEKILLIAEAEALRGIAAT